MWALSDVGGLLLVLLFELLPLFMLEVSSAFVVVGSVKTMGGRSGPELRTGKTSQWALKCSPSTELYGLNTLPETYLRSFVNVKRRTASIRSKGSSESLIAAKKSGLSRYCDHSRLGIGSRSEAGNERRMVAISFTPKHFLTSWTIILSLPPSPESPVSGTETAASSSSSSRGVAGSFLDIEDMVTNEEEEEGKKEGRRKGGRTW